MLQPVEALVKEYAKIVHTYVGHFEFAKASEQIRLNAVNDAVQ
jgi:hypothetical protein